MCTKQEVRLTVLFKPLFLKMNISKNLIFEGSSLWHLHGSTPFSYFLKSFESLSKCQLKINQFFTPLSSDKTPFFLISTLKVSSNKMSKMDTVEA